MEKEIEIRDTEVFMVAGSGAPRWFASESAAREYVGDRFADPDGPIPFLKRMMMSDVFLRLNELELNNRLA
jgi:hypothetical protein